jgi:hypothetical protein
MVGGLLGLALFTSVACGQDKSAGSEDGWIKIFNGQSFLGWAATDSLESWKIEDGVIKGSGPVSHLFFVGREFTDLEFKADIKLKAGSNSGMYFRTAIGPRFPKGYEAQVNNSHRDPKRTGSLYNFVSVTEQLVPDDTWWTQHVICKGNHIVIKVNDKVVVDFVDEKNTYTKGFVAFQQHDPNSEVEYKNVMVKPLD